MKAEQKDTAFMPITITLETREEAEAFLAMVDACSATAALSRKYPVAQELSNWFSSHVKL